MTVVLPDRPLPRSHWGQQVFSHAVEVRQRLCVMITRAPSEREDAVAESTNTLVEAALDAASDPQQWYVRLHEWWSGSRVEMCWSYLRAAELEIAAYNDLVRPRPEPPTTYDLDKKTFDDSAALHASVRAFRNRLLVVKAVILPVVAALIVIQAVVPSAQIVVDPSDDPRPDRWVTILLIMLFGVVGALITSIPAMSKIDRVDSPYNFPLQQGLVKAAVGALAALVGVVAIDYGTSGFQSLQKLLAAAVIFGAGQQAVTGFLDQRAKSIIEKLDAK